MSPLRHPIWIFFGLTLIGTSGAFAESTSIIPTELSKQNCVRSLTENESIQGIDLNHPTWKSIETAYQLSLVSWRPAMSLELGQRYENGDKSVSRLLRLGFSVGHENGKTVVRPPKTFLDFILSYHTEIGQMIESGDIKREDVIYPKLILFGKDNIGIRKKISYRPLVDPIPDNAELKLLGGFTMSQTEWERMVSMEKVFLIDIMHFLEHDLAHFADLIVPDYLIGIGNYYEASLLRDDRQIRLGLFETLSDAASREAIERQHADYVVRTTYIGEFLILPDITERERMIPFLLGNSVLDAGVEFSDSVSQNELIEMSNTDLLNFINDLVAQGPRIFARYGGAATDSYNFNEYVLRSDLIEEDVEALLLGRDQKMSLFYETAADNGLVLIEQLKLLKRLLLISLDNDGNTQGLTDSNVLSPSLRQFLTTMNANESYQKVRQSIIEVVIGIQRMMYYALKFGVTPGQILVDSKSSNLNQDSPTFRYFENAYPHHSILRQAFTRTME